MSSGRPWQHGVRRLVLSGGAEEHHGMLGVDVQGLSDHHASFRPDVDVLNAGHTGHDLPVTGELLIDEVELIGGSPDVGARRFDRESPPTRSRRPPERPNQRPGRSRDRDRRSRRSRPRPRSFSLPYRRSQRQSGCSPRAERWTTHSCRVPSRKSPGGASRKEVHPDDGPRRCRKRWR